MLCKNTNVKVRSPDGDTDLFHIVAGVRREDISVPYLLIIYLDYVLRTSIDLMKIIGFTLKKGKKQTISSTKKFRTQTTQMT